MTSERPRRDHGEEFEPMVEEGARSDRASEDSEERVDALELLTDEDTSEVDVDDDDAVEGNDGGNRLSPMSLITEDEHAGERLDRLVTEMLPGQVSRSEVQRWITQGHIRVDGEQVKSNFRLKSGMRVDAAPPPPAETTISPEPIALDIAYEDSDVIVVNKPRGMVVHPAHGHYTGTLVNALLYHCRDLSGIGGELRPGVVHRIDKDTSGLIMAAKNDAAHRALSLQLKAHTVKRQYLALVHGIVEPNHGTIDAPLGRSSVDRQAMAVDPEKGRHAITHFTVQKRFEQGYTLLSLQLETGRTHQIRVHMAYIHHPVVGDPKYGRKKTLPIKGQALHAAVLGFSHPKTASWLEFEAPMPEDMQRLLDQLGTDY